MVRWLQNAKLFCSTVSTSVWATPHPHHHSVLKTPLNKPAPHTFKTPRSQLHLVWTEQHNEAWTCHRGVFPQLCVVVWWCATNLLFQSARFGQRNDGFAEQDPYLSSDGTTIHVDLELHRWLFSGLKPVFHRNPCVWFQKACAEVLPTIFIDIHVSGVTPWRDVMESVQFGPDSC